MRLTITCEIPDELADPGHEMGVTDKGYVDIVEALMGIGCDDINTQPKEEEE